MISKKKLIDFSTADLSSVFDTADHGERLNYLRNLPGGLEGPDMYFLQSFQLLGFQRVILGTCSSDLGTFIGGVLQAEFYPLQHSTYMLNPLGIM